MNLTDSPPVLFTQHKKILLSCMDLISFEEKEKEKERKKKKKKKETAHL